MDQKRQLRALAAKVHERGGFFVVGGSFLSKLAAFLGSVVVVRLLSKVDYGLLASLESVYSYVYVLAGYGLNNALLRYMVLEDDAAKKKGMLSHVLVSGTLFNIVLVIASVVFVSVCPLDTVFTEQSVYFAIMLVALPLQFVFDASQCSLRALFLNRQFATLSLACVLTVWFSKVIGSLLGGLSGAVWAWPVSYALLALVGLWYVMRRGLSAEAAVRLSRPLKKSMAVYSVQYMITNGLWVLFMQNDIFLIGLLTSSPSDVASYKVAYTIPAALSIFSSSVGMFVTPYFVKHENDGKWVWSSFCKLEAFVFIIIAGVAVGLGATASPIINFFFGSDYSDSVGLMRVLLVSALLNNGLRFNVANLLAAMGRIKANLIVSATGMVFQIVLDIVLISSMGVVGAAYSSVLVYGFMALALLGVFVKRYRFTK